MRKSFDELTITDDFIFCHVMQDAEICKHLLSIILPKSIGVIKQIHYQRTVEASYNAKSIRLDVIAGDQNNRVYNIEMQVSNNRNLAKRLRYYQSLIDVSFLNKGADYEELPETYIIFFCTFDYLNKGLSVYNFKTVCSDHNDIILDDGVTKVIANSCAAEYEKNPELKAFFEYMNGQKSDNSFIKKLEEKVKELKENEEKREAYMILSPWYLDAKRDAKQEVRQEVKQEVLLESKLETAKNFKLLGVDIDKIAQATGLSVEEIEAL